MGLNAGRGRGIPGELAMGGSSWSREAEHGWAGSFDGWARRDEQARRQREQGGARACHSRRKSSSQGEESLRGQPNWNRRAQRAPSAREFAEETDAKSRPWREIRASRNPGAEQRKNSMETQGAGASSSRSRGAGAPWGRTSARRAPRRARRAEGTSSGRDLGHGGGSGWDGRVEQQGKAAVRRDPNREAPARGERSAGDGC